MSARLSLVLVSVVAACGGDDGNKTQVDAATTDVMMTSMGVTRVDPCPGTVDHTVTTPGNRYEPSTVSATQGQVVRFMVSSNHDVVPQPGTDPNLVVPLGGDRCYRFTMPGTFSFKCSPHGFTGTITVQ